VQLKLVLLQYDLFAKYLHPHTYTILYIAIQRNLPSFGEVSSSTTT